MMTTQTTQPQQSVLFIDSVVADYQILINGIKAGTKVVILNADQDVCSKLLMCSVNIPM